MRRALAWMAEQLFHACIEGSFTDGSVVIPILADLKLYRGDLMALVNETLPGNISLSELTERFGVKVFLDSFNEMPREHWDNASYERDLTEFLKIIGDSSLVIACDDRGFGQIRSGDVLSGPDRKRRT